MIKTPTKKPKPLHDGDEIVITCAWSPGNGFEIVLEESYGDFWLFLGEFVGWGHFRSCAEVFHDRYVSGPILKYLKDGGPARELEGGELEEARKYFVLDEETKKRYVLTAMRPPHLPAPSPVVSWSGVLWRQKEAREAWIQCEFYRRWGLSHPFE